MARAVRSRSIEIIAGQRAEDAMWGIPESPEFSSIQRLMNELQSHAAHEERWLSSYRAIATEANDPQVRFLLSLIVADEERHHELTARMISKLKDESAWNRSAVVSARAGETREAADGLLASAENFLDAERTGIKEYERLKKESRGLHRGLFALLYTTMVHDSHKHIEILNFLRSKLKENRQGARKRK
jgi:rubrerythrin